MLSISLGVLELPPPHHAVKMAAKVREALALVGLDPQVEYTFTTDSTSVMKSAVISKLKYEWLPCACHVPHNAAQRGMSALQDTPAGARILDMVTELPTQLKRSNAKWERFKAA